MVLTAFEQEHSNLRESGYDLGAIQPFVWTSALFSLWERAANLSSSAVSRNVKQTVPALVLVAREASARIAQSAESITATTTAALTGLQPWEIDSEYDAWEAWRVGTIVETEQNGAISFGHYETARQFYRFKAWRTQEDPDVRDSHSRNAREGPIPFDNAFSNGQLRPHEGYLLSEVVNCRCWLEEINL